MRRFVDHNIVTIEWLLGGLAVLLPCVAWLSRNDVGDLTLYDIFPPLGLIAFGLMWTHFVTGALRRFSGVKQNTDRPYTTISMGLVLALIVLHPGLLWLALYLDGFGLPPQSYLEVYSAQLGFVLLGSIALIIFLAYELKRFYGDRGWWKYVAGAQIIGMAAIFVHAIGLGNELRIDWFFWVWLLLGVTLMLSFVYSTFIHKTDKRRDDER